MDEKASLGSSCLVENPQRQVFSGQSSLSIKKKLFTDDYPLFVIIILILKLARGCLTGLVCPKAVKCSPSMGCVLLFCPISCLNLRAGVLGTSFEIQVEN